jgi:hypothetical protein
MALQRVNIGFYGTQVLAVRLEPQALDRLLDALAEGGWHDLSVEDGTIRLNLAQVIYVKTDRDEQRVGFGA